MGVLAHVGLRLGATFGVRHAASILSRDRPARQEPFESLDQPDKATADEARDQRGASDRDQNCVPLSGLQSQTEESASEGSERRWSTDSPTSEAGENVSLPNLVI